MASACGLFGKVQGRRDFITVGVPRRVLGMWEPWLQAGLARSKADLGTAWMPRFLIAPIWAFRLGAGLCGVEVAGALMPSMDGAGRCFPLCLLASGEEGRALASPATDAQRRWYNAVERFLLATLDPAQTYEAMLAELAHLPRPADEASFTRAEHEADRTTLWWTDGGETAEPRRFSSVGLPPPTLMTRLVGGSDGALGEGERADGR